MSDFSFSWSVAAPIIAAVVMVIGTVWNTYFTIRQNKKNARDLEALKTDLAFSFARKSKFADAEHDALLGCWTKLVEVDRALGALMGGAIINQFSPDKIKGIIKTHPEQFSDIESLKKYSYDHKDTFENQRRHLMEDVSNAVKEFGIFFENKKIFLDPDIKDKFLEVGIFISGQSLLSALAFDCSNMKKLNEQLKEYTKKIEQYIKGIKTLIRARIFP